MKKKIVKGTLGIIGIIVLGAIGSGLWDIGIKPIFYWFPEAIFKITTLGISSLSDSFYQSVAWELHEDTSNYLPAFIIFMIGMIYVLNRLMETYYQIQDLKKPENMKRDEKDKQHENLSPEAIRAIHKKEHEEALKNYIKVKREAIFSSRIYLVGLLIFLAFLFIQSYKSSYRSHLLAVFRQKFTATKVLMNEKEEDLILCKFTGIKSKQDYLDIINELKQKVDSEIQKYNSGKKATQSKP